MATLKVLRVCTVFCGLVFSVLLLSLFIRQVLTPESGTSWIDNPRMDTGITVWLLSDKSMTIIFGSLTPLGSFLSGSDGKHLMSGLE